MSDVFIKFLISNTVDDEEQVNLLSYKKEELINIINKLEQEKRKYMTFIKKYILKNKPMIDTLNKYNIHKIKS